MKDWLIEKIKKYKIVITILLLFLIWMLFFDEYNLFRIRRDHHKLKSLKEEQIYLKQKIETDREQLKKLQNDTPELEIGRAHV